MKFKVDENLPSELASDLRGFGHDAMTVYDEGIAGATDRRLIEVSCAEERIVLTLDKGIADVTKYPEGTHAGIVLFRPGPAGRRAVLNFLRPRLTELLRVRLAGRLTVVTEKQIRVR